MKKACTLFFAALLACGRVAAQSPVAAPALAPGERLARNEIEILVSPIALYPDPLVALILPAATNPSDIVLATRFLERGGSPEAAESEPWDSSVKSLTRYREVLTYLDENLEWTRRLGVCFLNQPDDVMNAIQASRARARTNGLLASTPEQEVIIEEEEIQIVPARPTVIYVPRYDPEILYVNHTPSYFYRPFLSFSVGYSVGSWLNYDCDWRHRAVHVVHRPIAWYHQPDWRYRYRSSPQHRTTWTRWAPHVRHDRHYSGGQRPVQSLVPRGDRRWSSDRDRSSRSDATEIGSTPGVASNWQGRAQNRPEIAADSPRSDQARTTGSRDRRRYTPRQDRPNAAASPLASGFAGTPPLTAPAVAAHVNPASAPATTPTTRRGNGDGNRGNYRNTTTQPNPGQAQAPRTRPNFNQRPASSPQQGTYTPPAQRAYTPPAERPQQRTYTPPAQRNYTPPAQRSYTPPAQSTPPPQRAVVQAPQPAPRANSDGGAKNYQRDNAHRGSRSDNVARHGSHRIEN